MRTPSKGGYEVSTVHLLLPEEASMVGLGYIQLSWPSVSQGNPQTTQAVAKTKELLSVDFTRAPIAEDNTHAHNSWNKDPYVLVSLVKEGTLQGTQLPNH